MAFNWYETDIDKAFAGQVSNMSLKNIDSYTAETSVGIDPGYPVLLGSTEGTVIEPTDDTDAASVIGVAVHIHREPASPYYAQYDQVPVMEQGDIYVVAGADVSAPGTVASILAGSGDYEGHYVFVPTGTTSAIAIDGYTFMESASEGDIVRIRIRK